ncbi:hypothetical protein L0F63_000104 [Massospora cicadina]|nr:hypothetical protein L0F63_000104 [Massospora cicadina]
MNLLQCHVTDKLQAAAFQELDVWSFDTRTMNFTVRIIDNDELQLVLSHARCTVLMDDLSDHFVGYAHPILGPEEDFFKNYWGYATMRRALKKWESEHKDIATFIPSIGTSHEKRDIFAFRLSTPSRRSKKGIWINGGLHAREWIAPTACMYLIHKLLAESKTPHVQKLLETFDFHFTPLANPDGYEFSRISGNRLWRKNRRNNGNGVYGVDLNRNWDEHWGKVGSSANPRSETYKGPYANSEPEVQALAKYALSIPARYGGLDLHSYGQYILRNWGWTTELSENEAILAPSAKQSKLHSTRRAELYPAAGALDDWMAAKANLISFTLELCPSGSAGFQLPPASIVKCSEGLYAAFLVYAQYLADHPNIPPNPPILP